jgi:hypothetical protein
VPTSKFRDQEIQVNLCCLGHAPDGRKDNSRKKSILFKKKFQSKEYEEQLKKTSNIDYTVSETQSSFCSVAEDKYRKFSEALSMQNEVELNRKRSIQTGS